MVVWHLLYTQSQAWKNGKSVQSVDLALNLAKLGQFELSNQNWLISSVDTGRK